LTLTLDAERLVRGSYVISGGIIPVANILSLSSSWSFTSRIIFSVLTPRSLQHFFRWLCLV